MSLLTHHNFPAGFSWKTGNIKPDVQLYIQLFPVLSASVLTCQTTFGWMSYRCIQECNGPWVMKTNWRYQTNNGCWSSLFLSSLLHFHPSSSPSSAHPYIKMKCWSVWEIWHPRISLWICHFTYRRLTSRHRRSERGNGAIIPVRFRGGTVITDLSICCHLRIECDCVSGCGRQEGARWLTGFMWVRAPRLCILFQRRNVTPSALSQRAGEEVSGGIFHCCLTDTSSRPK